MRIRKRSLIRFLVAGLAVGVISAAGSEPLRVNFEDGTVGEEPDGFFVIEGDMKIVENEGGKALQVAATPLVETGAIFGDSMKGVGGTVRARVKGAAKRRSAPRFGVGLHGLSGYRLRVVPAAKKIEVVKNEEVVGSAPLAWKAGVWTNLELILSKSGEAWKAEGRVWQEGSERPDAAGVTVENAVAPRSGKASIWGTPYAGLPILFDDVEAVSGSAE